MIARFTYFGCVARLAALLAAGLAVAGTPTALADPVPSNGLTESVPSSLPAGSHLATAPVGATAGPLAPSPTGTPAASPFECYDDVYFSNNGARQFVSEEQGYTGQDHYILRARSTTIGPWEKWNWCFDPSTGLWSLQSHSTLLWTSMEKGQTGFRTNMLRARASEVGPWERYVVYCVGNTANFAIQSEANGFFVTSQTGFAGGYKWLLTATSDTYEGANQEFYAFPGCS